MRRAELETAIYTALRSRAELTAQLKNGAKSIWHARAPAGEYDRCPFLVYSMMTYDPTLHGDDEEWLCRAEVRIHIVTSDGDFGTLEATVNDEMYRLGAQRRRTLSYMDEGRQMLIMDYAIVRRAE